MDGRFMLTITLGNEAMSKPEHIAGALESVAGRIRTKAERGRGMPGGASATGTATRSASSTSNPQGTKLSRKLNDTP